MTIFICPSFLLLSFVSISSFRWAAEEAVGGLIILEATYGQLFSSSSTQDSDPLVVGIFDESKHFLTILPPFFLLRPVLNQTDVTVPLQCLVRDSNLRLEATSKVGTRRKKKENKKEKKKNKKT